MAKIKKSVKMLAGRLTSSTFICGVVLLGLFILGSQQTARASTRLSSDQASLPASGQSTGPDSPGAACSGGPTIDGILLDECVTESFVVGGTTKTVTVWYTKNMATATRTVDGTTYTLQHGIDTNAQAQQVAAWGHEAWDRYYEIFNHHPFDTGCGDNINVRAEDGIGWSGIAYWGASGKCWIGIDSPTIRAGSAQTVVYHEFQHYLQYSFNSGCYKFLKDNYKDGKPEGDAEFVEGYADLAMDSINATVDAQLFNNFVKSYNPLESFYKKSYWDVFNKYFTEQLGSLWTVSDPQYHMDAVRSHYEKCDAEDTLYVLDSLVPSLKSGMTEEKLFLNFFAANWAKDWASHTAQPELVYFDDNPPDASLGPAGPSYGSISLWKDVNLASAGTQSWGSETTPDEWAARYYQVKPQTGCNFVTVEVDGEIGAKLGINLMAAKTSAPTGVERSAWIGEYLARTFSAAGSHDRIAAVVNAFSNKYDYSVSFKCVTPSLTILEPKQTNYALVGDPSSPIAFLARFKVTSFGTPVLGLAESAFTIDAEGDAVTIVPGSFSQVGEEYWAILLPPAKPAGTTFVDLRICLNTTICDTETHALLYVNPGNTDFALVFDASGSMATEDVVGEGKRVENAKKSGTVLADLLRVGDRILVTDFSANDNPVGCGLPAGSGNCTLDLLTRLARTSVTDPASTAIASTKTAISNISAREWTPIGAALRDAKNKLKANPTNTNPKHIVLLSDGEENVNPLYADVRTELIDSGVVIDTIAFSEDAPAALLAQIAGDTGGSTRYVPTTSGSLVTQGVDQAQAEALIRQGVSADLVENINTALLPGHLALADVYDYYETIGQDAARIFHENFTNIGDNTWQVRTQFVDAFINNLRLVVSGKQPDGDVTGSCDGYHRQVEVLPADAADPNRGWIPISPATDTKPAAWDVRNSVYDDVVIIPNPAKGNWKIRTRYYYNICMNGAVDSEATDRVNATNAFPSDFMMNGSAETNIQVEGRFLPPIVNGVGQPGDRVPIVATVFSKTGGMPGLIVLASVEKPGGSNLLLLLDDGLHSDGAAGDGIYGGIYSMTDVGGSYNVRIVAAGLDVSSNWAFREWLGSFWIKPIWQDDADKDGMPDTWERACNLDPARNDVEGDPDHDGLVNILEFHNGTLPCDPDTDDGGEMDGSEVFNKRNPLYAPDDVVPTLGHFTIEGLNGLIHITWPKAQSYSNMRMFISTVKGELGTPVDMGNSGVFDYPNVTNGQTYFITLAGQTSSGDGSYGETTQVTPKADPDAPTGTMAINKGAPVTHVKNVVLFISATDTPGGGVFQQPGALLAGPETDNPNQVSAALQMRISNDVTFAGASWEALSLQRKWTLPSGPRGQYRVFIQFRDGAGNESFVVSDSIEYAPVVFLPTLYKGK